MDGNSIKEESNKEEVIDVLEENNASDSKLETDLKEIKDTSNLASPINSNINEVTSLNSVTIINVNIENKVDVSTSKVENESESESHSSGSQTSSADTNPEDEKIGKASTPSLLSRKTKECPKLEINETLLKYLFGDKFDNEKFVEKLKSVEGRYVKVDYGKIILLAYKSNTISEEAKKDFARKNDPNKNIAFNKICEAFYKAIGIEPSTTDLYYYEKNLEKVKNDFKDFFLVYDNFEGTEKGVGSTSP